MALAEGDWWRAGGDTVCDRCGRVYYDHPQLDGWPTFHRICNGRIVKL